MQVSDAVLIEERERQGLQVAEFGVADISVYAHLHAQSVLAGDVVRRRLGDDHEQISGDEERHGIRGVPLHEMIEGVPLEYGHPDVLHASEKAADHHRDDGPSVRFYERQYLSHPEERKSPVPLFLCLLTAHRLPPFRRTGSHRSSGRFLRQS